MDLASNRHSRAASRSMADEPDDGELLAAYARDGEQGAFARLVRRHVRFVYGCALRQTHDSAAAEDVTQTVFTLLAREARTLSDARSLRGWLFTVAGYAASNERRAAARRRRHERRAARPEASAPRGDSADVAELAELLDAALARLSKADREAVLLRYFEGADAGAVAAALGVSQQAARRRISRAVERMRRYFAAGGVVVTATKVSTALTSPEEPPGLAPRVLSAATAPSDSRLRAARAVRRAMVFRAAAGVVVPMLLGLFCVVGVSRLWRAVSAAPGDRQHAAAVAPPVLPRRPVLRLTLAWSGQEFPLPMHATFPEELRQTDEYRRWESSGGARTFTWVSRDGQTYVCHADERGTGARRAASIALVQRFRPDGTLETETACDDAGAPLRWTTFAPDGKTKLASYFNCPPETPGGPFVQSVRLYGPDGSAREFDADRNGTVHAEWLVDEQGRRVRRLNG